MSNPQLETLLVEIERILTEIRWKHPDLSIGQGTDCDFCDGTYDGVLIAPYSLLRLRDAKAAYDKAKGVTPSGLHTNAIPEAASR